MIPILHSEEYFTSPEQTIAIELRVPQQAFPEHRHDFDEIVIINGGRGKHILNGKPYDLYPGMIFYIQAADCHLYEHVNDLQLTNILYRSSHHFHFLQSIEQLLADRRQEPETHWYIDKQNYQFVQAILSQLSAKERMASVQKESLFLQLLIRLQKGRYASRASDSTEDKIYQLLRWLKDHFTEHIEWHALAQRFDLPIRTLYRHIKSSTGCTPQRYLTKLRLSEAYFRLSHTE